MDFHEFFAAQFSRIERKESECRAAIHDGEFIAREEITGHRARQHAVSIMAKSLQVHQQDHSPKKFLSGVALRSYTLATEAAIPLLIGEESSSRDDIRLWESRSLAAIVRTVTSCSSRDACSELEKCEAQWRLSIEAEELSLFTQMKCKWLPFRIHLLTSTDHALSEPSQRKRLKAQEMSSRISLAVCFCCLRVAWDEEWKRLTIRLCHKEWMNCLRSANVLLCREVDEWRVLLDITRPIIEEIKELVLERHQRRERREHKLAVLQALRREELQRMQDLEKNREEYVLRAKIHMVESILRIQDHFLEEAAEYAMDPSVHERLRFQYMEDTVWLTSETTPFRDIKEYRARLLQRCDDEGSLSPTLTSLLQEADRRFEGDVARYSSHAGDVTRLNSVNRFNDAAAALIEWPATQSGDAPGASESSIDPLECAFDSAMSIVYRE